MRTLLLNLLLFTCVGMFTVSCADKPQNSDGGNNGPIKGDTGNKWWVVDGGPAGNPDKGQTDPKLDQVCYDGCIKKGQSADVCTKACGPTTPGLDKVCYDGCIKKGQSADVCTKACGGTDPGKGDACYDDCINLPKKPGHDTCVAYCGGKGTACKSNADCSKDPKTPTCDTKSGKCISSTPNPTCSYNAPCPCYENCIKAGGTPGDCEPRCYPGGVGVKSKEAEACYNQCAKDGGNKATCFPKCYPFQHCKETCLNANQTPDTCNTRCNTDCLNVCTKAGAQAADCKNRCPATTPKTEHTQEQPVEPPLEATREPVLDAGTKDQP